MNRWRPEPPVRPRRRLRPGMGCAGAAVLLLVGLVLGGHLVLEKGVRMVVARAVTKLAAAIPPDMEAGERRNLEEGLRAWYRDLPRGRAGERLSGRFLKLAEEILADGRMDPDEAQRLRRFLAGEPAP